MSTLIFLIGGLTTGTLSLVPGLHLGALFVLFAPWLLAIAKPIDAVVFLVAASAVGVCGRALSVVYHPVVGNNLASADPAQRLAAQGKGIHAVTIFTEGIKYALVPIVFLGAVMVVGALFKINPVRTIEPLISWFAPFVIGVWYVATILKSRRKAAALFASLLIGLYGFVCLRHPGLSQGGHILTPMLAGLFAVPILVSTLRAQGSAGVPANQSQPGEDPNPTLWGAGTLFGIATGFLAGLGSGSLVSLAEKLTQSDEDYLALSGTAEASNDLWALMLVVSAGIVRSSDAVALNLVTRPLDAAGLALVVVVQCLAIAFGITLVKRLAPRYAAFVTRVPMRAQALFLLSLVVGTVLVQTGITGILIMLVGYACAAFARQNYLPNQVTFSSLVFPLVLYYLGISGTLAALLFG